MLRKFLNLVEIFCDLATSSTTKTGLRAGKVAYHTENTPAFKPPAMDLF